MGDRSDRVAHHSKRNWKGRNIFTPKSTKNELESGYRRSQKINFDHKIKQTR